MINLENQVSVLPTTETRVVEIIVMRVEVSLSVAWKKRAQTIVSWLERVVFLLQGISSKLKSLARLKKIRLKQFWHFNTLGRNLIKFITIETHYLNLKSKLGN